MGSNVILYSLGYDIIGYALSFMISPRITFRLEVGLSCTVCHLHAQGLEFDSYQLTMIHTYTYNLLKNYL